MIEIDEGAVGPKAAAKLLASDYGAATLKQKVRIWKG
jgi:hypothetical protein